MNRCARVRDSGARAATRPLIIAPTGSQGMKIPILFVLATTALTPSAATAAAYDDAGECANAVADSCNGK